jgi:hypothetical protein
MRLSTIRRVVETVLWDFETHEKISQPNGHLCIDIAESGNPEHRAAIARKRMERLDDLRAGGDRAERAARDIETWGLAEGIIRGWHNMDGDDGVGEVVYSPQTAFDLLSDRGLWPFRAFVEDTSGIARLYREQEEEDAKGN